MKITENVLWFITAILFFIAAVVSFLGKLIGNVDSIAFGVICLALCFTFLGLAVSKSKKT